MKTIILFLSCLMALTACLAQKTSTPIGVSTTPESRDQESRSCTLVSSPDIEKALGLKVAPRAFLVDSSLTIDGEKSPFFGDDICQVYAVADGRDLVSLIISNHTSVNVNSPIATFTPFEWFEYQRQYQQKNLGDGRSQFQDLSDVSDKAYLVEGNNFREVHFFKSGVEYILMTSVEYGISSELLIKVTEIVVSQIP